MEGERSCFNCAVLGKCPLAGKVENCKLYVKSRFTKHDVAKALGVSERTVYRLIQSDKGRKEMLELLRKAGIRLVLDVQGKNGEENEGAGQIAYYRKVEFSDRLAQAQVNVNLGARLARGI